MRAETRDRVLAAMEKLDYRPNPVARALVTGRSKTLGVVTFNTTLYGPASTLVGVERAAHAAGYFISIVSLESLERAAVLQAVERLRALGVDGLVMIAPHVASLGALWDLPADLPVVAVEAGPQDVVAVAEVDQYEGARLATQHLLDLGHATVHHLGGPPRAGPRRSSAPRAGAARSTPRGAKGTSPLRGDWSARSGYELGQKLLDLPDVTAIFVANDQMALGLLRVLHERGCDVPGDVSIVGFDDIPESAYFSPPLTTVRQDFNEMGRRGLHLLLEEIAAGKRSTGRATVPASLVVRASTAPPR